MSTTSKQERKHSSRQDTLYKWTRRVDKIPREKIIRQLEKLLSESSQA